MPQVLRQQEIAQLVNNGGAQATVDDLSRRFGVSGMTIRRDLQALASAGRIFRTHGGAAPAQRVMFEFQFLQHTRTNRPAKQAIASVAAGLIRDGQSVMLDSSTTTLAIAERLKDRSGLSVITTSLPIASTLQYCQGLEVLLLGGYVRHGAPDLAGPLTESNIENLRADLAFLGADGIDAQGNIFNDSPAVARMLGKMAASCGAVYAVADATKIGHTALARYGNVAKWAGLITDSSLDKSAAAALRLAGVNLLIAKPQPQQKGDRTHF